MALSPDNVAQLAVGGQFYEYFTSLQVRCEWDAPVRSFAFTTGPAAIASAIDTGMTAVVRLNGSQIVKGYINGRSPSFDAHGTNVILQGMSVTSPITRSSVPLGAGYENTSFPQIVRSLLQPHGIALKIDNPPAGFDKPFKRVIIQPGATVFATIERLARMRGVILGDDENGNLVVRQHMGASSGPVADFVEGENILSAQGAFRDDTLFEKIKAVGSMRGDDDFWPSRDVSATRTDDKAKAGTVKVIVAEHAVDPADAQTRADMEGARAVWTSVIVIVTVQGWNRPDGQLWQITDHVTVRSPTLFNKPDPVTLGTKAITFSQGPQGTTTALELILPQYLSTRKDPGVSGSQDDLLAPQNNPAKPDGSDAQGG